MHDSLVRPGDAARALNIHPNTLLLWRREGKITAVIMPSGKSWRYPASEVRRILEGRESPVAIQEEAYA